MNSSRRQAIATFGFLALGYTAFRFAPSLSFLSENLAFEPLDNPTGFRRYVAGETTSALDPFIGLSAGDNSEEEVRKAAALDRVSADICSALYGNFDSTQSTVPMASFSDYYCPLCRVQTKRLSDLATEMGNEIEVVWHELPLLGEYSTLAAKAALAAKRQGAYVAFHERLMKSPFQATPEYLSVLSNDLGLDEAVFLSDVESDRVAQELENSSALAELFVLIGTPALVIGRTVVQGQISDRTIRQIVEMERSENWYSVCV